MRNPSTTSPDGGIGSEDHIPNMYDDAANARAHVEAFVRRGKDIMVVGHGYGAIVASQCVQGLSKGEMEAAGRRRKGDGGVVRLLFIAGVIGVEGHSYLEATGGWTGSAAPDGVAVG